MTRLSHAVTAVRSSDKASVNGKWFLSAYRTRVDVDHHGHDHHALGRPGGLMSGQRRARRTIPHQSW